MGKCSSKTLELNENVSLAEQTFTMNIKTCYEFLDFCGSGHYGAVSKAVSISDPTKEFAIKKISKEMIVDAYELRSEVNILCKLHHPNIIKIFETYEDMTYFYIVMQYCKGGTLSSRINLRNKFSEAKAAAILKQIMRAIRYLHIQGICHRDIKPENFLFSSVEENAKLKLIDFGLSHKNGKWSKSMNEIVGTRYYMAPEVINRSYDMRCDIWSLGVIMYFLLSGRLPFYDKSTEVLASKILHTEPSFSRDLSSISQEARDLVSRLLCKNPAKRIKIEAAYNHPWFSKATQEIEEEAECPIQHILQYAKREETLSRISNQILNALDYQEITKVAKTLAVVQKNTITLKELELLLGLEFHVKDPTLLVNPYKLITSAAWAKLHLNEERIFKAFRSFDKFHNNKISHSELLKIAMQLEGRVSPRITSYPEKIVYSLAEVMTIYKNGKALKSNS